MCWFGSSMILSHFMTSRRTRATRRVGLVVHEGVAAVIGAVGEREMRMMQVAVHVGAAAGLEKFAGLRQQPFGQHLQAFVGHAPAGGAAAVEHRERASVRASREGRRCAFRRTGRWRRRRSIRRVRPGATSVFCTAGRAGGAFGAAVLVCASAVETKPLPSFVTTAPPASPTPAAAAVVPSNVRRLTPLSVFVVAHDCLLGFRFRLQVE